MDLKEIKKTYNLTNEKLAKIFGFKSVDSYKNSSAKSRYENAVVELYKEFNNKA